ncbi:SH3 domain-containing protein [Gemmobacter aquatilis]|nr:SH3 domain-containing protein [Gemmobacter aquatilis]
MRFTLGARGGQRMIVEMTTSNASAYFNITAPGAAEALHIGSVAGNNFEGLLPTTGDYTVEVYLMRNAARRGEAADFAISFRIAAAAAAVQSDFADGLAGGPDYWAVSGLPPGDRLNLRAGPGTAQRVLGSLGEGEVIRNLGCRMEGGGRWCQVSTSYGTGWVAGRFLRESSAPGANIAPPAPLPAAKPGQPRGNGEPFTAMGTLPCARAKGQPTGPCAFGVIRPALGEANLWIAHPQGGERYILFQDGAPVFTDAQAKIRFEREVDLYLIRIGAERFEVPRAVIYGG